jgi:hypothetical protein
MRLLHCSVFKERTVARPPLSESTDRPGGAKRQRRYGLARPAAPVRHDGYHIAANMACQGIDATELPAAETAVTES